MSFHSLRRTSRQRAALLASPATAARSHLALGPGQPLQAGEREVMESHFGSDFSGVRVHADETAAASARVLGAKAYAVGDDIVFAAGRYRPGGTQAKRLLAHELAHVAQQQQGGTAGVADAEPRAKAAADAMATGTSLSPEGVGSAQQGIYCDDDEEKKDEGVSGGSTPSPAPTVVPPVIPRLTLPPLDWGKLSGSYLRGGSRLTLRDVDDISEEHARSSRVMTNLGIGPGAHLGPFTRDWVLELGIAKQIEDQQARENPTAIDRMNKEWKDAHPGGWQTPMIMSPNLWPWLFGDEKKRKR